MSDADITPVEEYQRPTIGTPVPRMEVAVHEGVGDAAGLKRRETIRKVPDERVEVAELVVRQFARTSDRERARR